MSENKVGMNYESVLPADFDGTFRFTNWSDAEFIGIWGKKEYRFPALSTSPMIIPEHSPLEVQHIRRKFATDLGEREFFKSKGYEHLRRMEGEKIDGMLHPRLNSMQMAGSYTLNELAPFIQRCLEPLPVARAIVQDVVTPSIEDKLSRNENGELNTEAVDRKTSLRDKALKS